MGAEWSTRYAEEDPTAWVPARICLEADAEGTGTEPQEMGVLYEPAPGHPPRRAIGHRQRVAHRLATSSRTAQAHP